MKKTKVIVCIEGGVLQGAVATTKNIDFEVFDVDNLEAEGMSNNEIRTIWKNKVKEMKAIF